jgi:Recombination endonuclease VII
MNNTLAQKSELRRALRLSRPPSPSSRLGQMLASMRAALRKAERTHATAAKMRADNEYRRAARERILAQLRELVIAAGADAQALATPDGIAEQIRALRKFPVIRNTGSRSKERRTEYQRGVAKLPKPTRTKPDRCECCGNLPGARSLCLDHCHVSNQFRGWVCHRCNIGIGTLSDSIHGLMNAVRYLQRAAEQRGE